MDVEVWDDAHKRTARGVLKFVRSARVDGVVSRTCAGRVAGRLERCEAKEVNLCRSREIACSCAAADEIEALHVDAVRVEHRQKRGGIAFRQLDPQLDFAVPRRELGLPPPADLLDGLRVLVVNVPE